MAHHNLKIIPEHFEAIVNRSKKCEIRFNDRNYQIGDTFTLYEGSQELINFMYTGRSVSGSISHIIKSYGLQEGFVCLSLADVGMLIINRGEK